MLTALCLLPLPAAALGFWLMFLALGHDPMRALFRASLLWGALALGLSEALGLFGALGFVQLWPAWSAAALMSLGFWLSRRPAFPRPPRLDSESSAYALLAAAAALLSALVALASAPNTYDVLFYHLPRVEHWIQDHSLRHFPSHYDLQDFYPFGAEAIVLQFRLLAGDDRFSNAPQWLAYLGCAAAAGRLAGQAGAGRRAAWLAALAALSLPMAMLQATTAQNDLVASWWIMAAAVMAQDAEDSDSVFPAAWAAAACGLALATKGTAYFYVLPLGLMLAWRRARRRALWALPEWLLLAALAALPSAGQWARNASLSGGIFGSASDHFARILSPASLLAQLSKNLLSHAAFPTAWNAMAYHAVEFLNLKLGFSFNEPALNWIHSFPGIYGVDAARRSHEDYAGNMIQLLLIVLAPLAAARFRGSPAWKFTPQLACACVGMLLYCLLVKWNPWASRLHMAFFMLAAPWIGAWLAEWAYAPARLGLAGLMLAYGLSFLLSMPSRPVWGPASVFRLPRLQQTFYGTGSDPRVFMAAADLNRRFEVKSVGLRLGEFRWEYLFWASFKASGWLPRVENIGVQGLTAPLEQAPPYRDFVPDAVILAGIDAPQPWDGQWKGLRYRRIFSAGNLSYYLRPGLETPLHSIR